MQQKDKIALAIGVGLAAYMFTRPKKTSGTQVNAVIARANATPAAGIPVTVGGNVYGIPYSTVSQVGSSLWSGLTSLFSKPTSASVIDTFASGGISTADVPVLDFPTPDLSAGNSTYSLLS